MKYFKLYEEFRKLLTEDIEINGLKELGFSDKDLEDLDKIKDIKPKYQVLGDGNSPDLYYETEEFQEFFKKHKDKFKKFLKEKNLDSSVLDYWFRGDNEEHQEWIQIAPVFSEIILGNEFTYKLEDFDPNDVMGDNSRKMWECDKGRRYKLYSFMMKGGYEWKTERSEEEEEDVKKLDVKDAPNAIKEDTTELKGGVEDDLITCDEEKAGSNWNNGYWLGDEKDYSDLNTPKEREEKMIKMTEEFVTSGDQDKKPIVIYMAKEGQMKGKPQILDGAHRVFLCQWINDVHNKSLKLKAIILEGK
jgi:hypothetical protein